MGKLYPSMPTFLKYMLASPRPLSERICANRIWIDSLTYNIFDLITHLLKNILLKMCTSLLLNFFTAWNKYPGVRQCRWKHAYTNVISCIHIFSMLNITYVDTVLINEDIYIVSIKKLWCIVSVGLWTERILLMETFIVHFYCKFYIPDIRIFHSAYLIYEHQVHPAFSNNAKIVFIAYSYLTMWNFDVTMLSD